MLEEAVGVMRALFTGETHEHRGRHYEVENARLFDPPATDVPIIVSGRRSSPKRSPEHDETAGRAVYAPSRLAHQGRRLRRAVPVRAAGSRAQRAPSTAPRSPRGPRWRRCARSAWGRRD
jgi:alkanesulfonate monooxygenase SsuD/methylene tetrahydromethanopterin reductase-like flavin-dependent oxidoreductase (luciferase family)